MFGVAFILEEAKLEQWKPRNACDDEEEASSPTAPTQDPHGPIGGQIVSTLKDAYSEAFFARSPRLIQPMYKCFVQATSVVLGNLHTVISKRRGKIIDEQF